MVALLPLRIRPAIVLFGDSITQQGFGLNNGGGVGWVSLLASAYARRADVFNRGFSGYNTRHALEVLPRVFGETNNNNSPSDEGGIVFCTVFFGANDAALPGERQHVPIDEYGDNLRKIVTSIRQRIGGSAYNSTTQDNTCNRDDTWPNNSNQNLVPIILMTPPPVDVDAWFQSRAGNNEDNHDPKYDRANHVARQYGARVKDVAKEFHHNTSVLDVFDLLGGNHGTDVYGKNLRDGLHLSERGNILVYEGLMELIQTEYPELAPMMDGNGRYGSVGVPLEEKLWSELC